MILPAPALVPPSTGSSSLALWPWAPSPELVLEVDQLGHFLELQAQLLLKPA
jgi:hypothetical protein